MIPYLVRSFRGGVSDENNKGVAGSFKYGYGIDIHDRDDVLKCASSMVTIDETTVTDLINFFVPASDGTTYAFGSTGSIYAVSGNKYDPVVTFVYNDENGAIKGAAEWKISDGNNYLMWATNTSVARRALNGSADTPWPAGAVTQDYKTTLDSAPWHTMKNASGVLNIANGNFLATFDYDGNFNPAAMNLRPGNIAKAFDERDDYVIIGSERGDNSEEGHIWSWVTNAYNWIQKKRIPVQGVNSLITTEIPILQGGDAGEIFYADFENSTPLHAIPGGGTTNPGGVSIENDLAVFGIYGGTAVAYPGIWSLGRRNKNRPTALNQTYRLAKTVSGSTISTIGAVTVVNGLTMVSWATEDSHTSGTTFDFGIDLVSSTTRASAVYEGLEFTNGQPTLKKFFDYAKITMVALPSGCSISYKFKVDKGSSWYFGVLAGGSTTFSQAGETEAVFMIKKDAKVFEAGLELTPSGSDTPEIISIATYLGDGTKAF